MKKLGVDCTFSFMPRWRDLLDAVQDLLILQALVEALLAEAGLPGDAPSAAAAASLHHPFSLLLEQGLDHREVFVRPGAARQHEAGGGQRSSGNSRKMKRTLPVSM